MCDKRLDETLDKLVVALCADFPRRKREIESGMASRRAEMEYRYLNFKMISAADEVVGIGRGEQMIEEIAKRIGYYSADFEDLSEKRYKLMKAEVKRNIARKLRLCD